MTRRELSFFSALSILSWLTVSCTNDPSAPPSSNGSRLSSSVNAVSEAPGLVEQAIAGVVKRGEQDEMLKLEAQLPGFGGFFIDSIDQVVVYMKPFPQSSPAKLRQVLYNTYATRTDAKVRQIMAPASRAVILDGQFSLSELIAIENRITRRALTTQGLVGVGTSLKRNRVAVGFRDNSSMQQGVQSLVAAGIPLDALLPEVWGEIYLTTTWKDKVRPTRGGIGLAAGDVYSGGVHWASTGSHGFNVHASNGTDYFMTASHLANTLHGTNGATGDTVFQPVWDSFINNAIGVIVVSPAWLQNTACPQDSVSSSYPDYCTQADIALGTFVPGVSGERKIGTSTTEGQNGASGTQSINNWYSIAGVLSPEFVKDSSNKGVHKSGQTTGTTTGVINLPITQIVTQVPWPAVPTPPTVWKSLIFYNVARVAHAGWGGGDSGGAVFAGNGSPYYALGIQVAGSGGTGGGITCTGGTACAFYFTRWDKIQQVLGFTLNPNTVQ